MLSKLNEAVKELGGLVRNPAGVLRLFVLLPGEVDGPEEAHQRRRGGDENAFARGGKNEFIVTFECGA